MVVSGHPTQTTLTLRQNPITHWVGTRTNLDIMEFLSFPSFHTHNIVHSWVYIQIRQTVFKMLPLQEKNKQENCSTLK